MIRAPIIAVAVTFALSSGESVPGRVVTEIPPLANTRPCDGAPCIEIERVVSPGGCANTSTCWHGRCFTLAIHCPAIYATDTLWLDTAAAK